MGAPDSLTDKGLVVTTADKIINWTRTGSMWPKIRRTNTIART